MVKMFELSVLVLPTAKWWPYMWVVHSVNTRRFGAIVRQRKVAAAAANFLVDFTVALSQKLPKNCNRVLLLCDYVCLVHIMRPKGNSLSAVAHENASAAKSPLSSSKSTVWVMRMLHNSYVHYLHLIGKNILISQPRKSKRTFIYPSTFYLWVYMPRNPKFWLTDPSCCG